MRIFVGALVFLAHALLAKATWRESKGLAVGILCIGVALALICADAVAPW